MNWNVLWGPTILLAAAGALLAAGLTIVLIRRLQHPPRRTAGDAVARGAPLDPLDAGATRFDTLLLDDGTEMWWMPGDDDAGPAVIIIHGWGESRHGSLLWFDVLRPVCSAVGVFDLPGHGESPHRKFAWGGGQLRVLRHAIEAAKRRADQKPVVMLGLSMGGVLAIDAGGQSAASAVIADSPYRRWTDAVGAALRRLRLPRWPMLPLAGAWMRLRLPHLRGADTCASARQLTVPLRVVHGEQDAITSTPDARAIAEAAPQGRLITFPDATHLAAACTDPDAYRATLKQFFDSLS